MMTEGVARLRRLLLLILVGHGVIAGVSALGQAGADKGVKGPEFDVVSIRPNHSGKQDATWGVNENRFRSRDTPLAPIILQAYLGQMNVSLERLKNAPSWVTTDPYDITAKADDATAETWKDLRQEKKLELAAPLLRTMLEDRCKLVAHTVPTEIQRSALVVGKRGVKMKEAQPDEPVPESALTFEGGWKMIPIPMTQEPDAKQSVTYLQITMAEFAKFLSMGGTPILDQTGLTGKYDFELPRIETSLSGDGASSSSFQRMDAAHMFNWGAIGLEMKPVKVPALDVVIDHIEKPTEN